MTFGIVPLVPSANPSGFAPPTTAVDGFAITHSDDFPGSSLDLSHWFTFAGPPGGTSFAEWNASQVTVAGSILTLATIRDDGISKWLSGGVGSLSGNFYGGADVMLRRTTPGTLMSCILLLWPDAGEWPIDWEDDFYEDGGGAGGTLNTFASTLHFGSHLTFGGTGLNPSGTYTGNKPQIGKAIYGLSGGATITGALRISTVDVPSAGDFTTTGGGSVTALGTGAASPNNFDQIPQSGSDATQWHCYSVRWIPGFIYYYIDGVLVGTQVTPIPEGVPLNLDMQIEYIGNAYPGTGSVDTTDIDWAVEYSYSATPPSGSVFIAGGLHVGPNVVIATSPDAATWTPQSTPNDVSPGQGVAALGTDGAGTFLAGSLNATNPLMASGDGVTWSAVAGVPTSLSVSVWAILWVPSLSLWIIGLDGDPAGIIATSPDGVIWTLQTTPFDPSGSCFALATDGTTIVAGGYSSDGIGVIMTSTDGISWTEQTTPFDGWTVYSLAWVSGLSLFVAGGSSATNNVIMTSPDGVTWTAQTTPMDGSTAYFVEAVGTDGTTIVAGGYASTTQSAMSSTDGTTWTFVTMPWDGFTMQTWGSAFFDSLWLAGADGGSSGGPNIATSSDAATWTATTSPFDGDLCDCFVFGPVGSGPSGPTAASAVVRVVGTAAAFAGPPPPPPWNPTSGPSNHNYEVIICDKYGMAQGQIVSAVVTEVDDILDDIGQALIDFWILDPSAALFTPQDLPGGVEIQIWRDNNLFFWGVPVSATFDTTTVHLTVQDLTWYWSVRNFGPNPFNYLVNGGFESSDPTIESAAPGWSEHDLAAPPLILNKNEYGPSGLVLEGNNSCQLLGLLGHDAYIHQFVTVTTGPDPITYDCSAWVYLLPWTPSVAHPYPLPWNSRGLFMQALVGGNPILGSPQAATVNGSTTRQVWTRLDAQVVVPANTTAVLEVRLYGNQAGLIWDAAKLTSNLAVGMKQSLDPGSITALLDVFYIIRNILTYAQDPTWGKSDLAIPVRGTETGTRVLRLYNLSDNGGVLDALNEFPSIGVCDFGMEWDATGHFRWFQVYHPAKGQVKYNYPIEIGYDTITSFEGGVDGSQAGTAQWVLGQGSSGSSEDVGYAAFPSYIGGKVSEGNGTVTQGSTTVVLGSGGFFVPSDVGKPIYSLAQALPIGTVIESYINSGAVTVTTPHNSDPSGGGIVTVTNDTIGVGGYIQDSVQSSIQDLPIGSLQGTAQQALLKNLASQVIPTAKYKDDVIASIWPHLNKGDVVPVAIDFGWIQVTGILMRIMELTWYPETDEVAPTLNIVNGEPT